MTAALAGARILVVPNECPFPATSGGRIDVSRRLRQLRGLGAELALLSWYDAPREGPPDSAARAELEALCPAHRLVPITRSPVELARRLAQAGRLPSHAAARWVTLQRPAVLAWARAFKPTLLLLDGLYGAAVVRWLAAELSVPWAYRSHNVEHRYMRQQAARAGHWRQRLGLWANLLGLEALERRTLREASAVFDISPDDAAYWNEQRDQARPGCPVLCWPPLVDDAMAARLARPADLPRWDALYFGNLNTPNNVDAVCWWIDEVLPLLPGPGLRLAVAGSRPSAALRERVARDARVTLLADPPALADEVAAARTLVNPVRSSSGVNLKSVEMLFTGAALVSTGAGVRGLTPAAAACFEVCDDAAGFASAMQRAWAPVPAGDALHHQAERAARRAAARRPYTPDGIPKAVVAALAVTAAPGEQGLPRQAPPGRSTR
jgi:polysaccharide biosynthesis protein PslH